MSGEQQDFLAEMGVLGAMLQSADVVDRVGEMLSGDDFCRPRHQMIFDGILAVHGRGEVVDPVTVGDELLRRGQSEASGGALYLLDLIKSPTAQHNAIFHAERVAEKAVRRRLAEAGLRLAQQVEEGTRSTAELLEEARTTFDLSVLSANSGESWTSPIPLEWMTEDIPVDALGDILGPLVQAVSHSFQVHPDLVVGMALPTIATAIRGRLSIRIKPDWTEIIALSTVSVAASAERKSPLHRLITKPLSEHEADQKKSASKTIARKRAELQFAQERADQLRKAALKSGTEMDRDHYLAAAEDVSELASKLPALPRWIASDATPEAIVRLLADHGAVGVLSSEPGLFAILAGRYSGGRSNVETVLQATSGDPIIVDRADGERSVHIERPALSASMCIQNGRLPELNIPEFVESGLLARLLITIPPSTVGYRKYDVASVPQGVTDSWSSAIRGLAASERRGEITLTRSATRALECFGEEIEPQLLRHVGRLTSIGAWAGKLPGQCARIAALLTLLSDPNASVIQEDQVVAAIRIGRAYMAHALTAFAVIRQRDDRVNQAQAVMHTVLRKGWEKFNTRELLRAVNGQAWVSGIADLDVPLAALVERGHIRLAVSAKPEAAARRGGRPPSPTYLVNPAHFSNSPKSHDKTDETLGSVTSVMGFPGNQDLSFNAERVAS